MLVPWRAEFNVWFRPRRVPPPDAVHEMLQTLSEVQRAADAGDRAEAGRRLGALSAARLALPLERAKMQATLDEVMAALLAGD